MIMIYFQAWGWSLLEWAVVSGQAMSLEQGTQTSMTTLRAATTHQNWPSQWRHLPTQYYPNPPTREGVGMQDKKPYKLTIWCLKQTYQPHTDGTHNTCDLRNPVCHIMAHGSLTSIGLISTSPKLHLATLKFKTWKVNSPPSLSIHEWCNLSSQNQDSRHLLQPHPQNTYLYATRVGTG